MGEEDIFSGSGGDIFKVQRRGSPLVAEMTSLNSGLKIGPLVCRALKWKERRELIRGFLFVNE